MRRTIAKVRSERFKQVTFDSQRIKADGRSFCVVRVILDPADHEPVNFRLTAGSFSPERVVREMSFEADESGVVSYRIYSPRTPRSGFLLAEGLKAPLQFSPANYFQYLAFDLVPTLFFAIVFALVIRSFAVASFYIPSGSMEPTLHENDRVIADRFSYTFNLRRPQCGDIIIFRYPEDPKVDYIKRVIGVPGDVVEIRLGEVLVNGEPLQENYIAESPHYDLEPTPVPDGEYFVLGDNRNRSRDSHIWGFVPQRNLVGEALVIYWPVQRARVLRNPHQGQ